MPFTIGLALVFGNVTDRQLESREILDDPVLRSLVQRIRPRIDGTLSNANPNHLPGSLEITTRDGHTRLFEGTGTAAGSDFKDAVLEKFALNVESHLTAADSQALIEAATGLGRMPDVRAMMRLLRRPA